MPSPREHQGSIYRAGPLKQLDKGAARRHPRSPPVSGLMELEDQRHVQRRRFSREPMRQANWVRAVHCGSLTGGSYSGYPMGPSRPLSAFYTN
jgi:hypothetical protein